MFYRLNLDTLTVIQNKIGYNIFFILKTISKKYNTIFQNNLSSINDYILHDKIGIWYINYINIPLKNINLNYGLKYNYINVLEYLKNDWGKFTIKHAIHHGSNINTINYLIENNCPINEWIMVKAVSIGNFELMEYLYKKNIPLTKWSTAFACKCKNDSVLKWLISKNCPYDNLTFYFACSSGNLKIVKFLFNIGCPLNNNCYAWAIKKDHLHIIKWLFSKNIPITNFKLEFYIRQNNFKSIIWSMNNMIYSRPNCIKKALKFNNIQLINYLT